MVTAFIPLLLAVALPLAGPLHAAEGPIDLPEEGQGVEAAHAPKEFNVRDFIFGYISDSYEWKILTVGERKVAIPLPVILYSLTRNRPYIFFSSRFRHGYHTHQGFRLVTQGEHAGKIVEVDASGAILEGAPLPLDFSITKNVVAIFFSLIVIALIFIPIARRYQLNDRVAPTGVQNLFEAIILFVRDEIARPAIGEKNYLRFMPFLLTLFFFIWINNLLGLIPIFPAGANVTGNIAVTMALAVATFLMICVSANANYWKHIFNTPGIPVFLKLPIPIMPFVEVLGALIKPAVLMIRLFANILAGKIIVMVFFSLIFIFGAVSTLFGFAIVPVSLGLVLFMKVLELLVAAIQSYVFTMLTALFLGMATEEHH